MAGIGFELRRILAEDTYSGMIKGYLYSTVISSGPWLITVLSLAGLGSFAMAILEPDVQRLFASTVIYMYCASLVGTGLIQLVVTRYLADQLYQGRRQALSETFLPVVLVTTLLLLPVALLAVRGTPWPLNYRIAATAGFLLVALVSQLMVFLSASRDYRTIVLAYLVGGAASWIAGVHLGNRFGLAGFLFGFDLGQLLLVGVLTAKVFWEFGAPRRWDWGFLRCFLTFPELAGIGFLYNFGIWVDKLLFGFSAEGQVIAGRFASYPAYDSSLFFAHATTIPAMALFLARTETDFADVYKTYYDDIYFHRPYRQILASKKQMVETLAAAFRDLLKVQGLVTFLGIYFADDILALLGLSYSQTGIFRYAQLGALMQMLMLFIHIVLLYFDLRGTVLVLTLIFMMANAVGALASLRLGLPYYGLGYALACLVGLGVSVIALYVRLLNLEYITFARRKIVGQVYSRRKDRARPGGLYGKYHLTRAPKDR